MKKGNLVYVKSGNKKWDLTKGSILLAISDAQFRNGETEIHLYKKGFVPTVFLEECDWEERADKIFLIEDINTDLPFENDSLPWRIAKSSLTELGHYTYRNIISQNIDPITRILISEKVEHVLIKWDTSVSLEANVFISTREHLDMVSMEHFGCEYNVLSHENRDTVFEIFKKERESGAHLS